MESKDSIILQIKIEESAGGKNTEKAKVEVDALATSIVGLAKANKQLREERNKLDTSTEEGAKRIQELNKLIDHNNELIKKNSSNLEKQRMNVGNYKRGVVDALKELRIGGVNVGDVVDKLSKANEDLFQGMIQGYKNSGIQAKLFGTTARAALTATGIGVFLVALGAVVAYWDDIKKAIGGAAEEQKKFLDNARKELENQQPLLERRIELLKLWGATQAEINRLTIPNLKERIALNEEEIKQIDRQIELLKKRKGIFADPSDLIARQEELRKANEDLLGQITYLNSEEQKQEADKQKNKKETAAQQAKIAKEKEERENQEVARYMEAVQKELEADRLRFEEEQKQNEERAKMSEKIREDFGITVDENAAMNRMIAAQNKKAADDDVKNKRIAAEIKKQIDETSFMVTTSLLGRASSLFRENTAAYKVLASAEALMNTYAGAAKALKDFTFPLGAIFAGIITAQGLAAVAKINNVKFAEGGEFVPNGLLVGGRSHAQGGTKYVGQDGNRFEVERGEGIYILKKSAQQELNYLSTLNQKHGGRSFGQKTWYAAQGGQIETREISSRSQQNSSIAKMIAATIANMPRPVVYVEDIRSGVDRVVDIENNAAPI